MPAAVAPAAAAAAPCPQPPRAAGARPRSGGGLRVRVPLRLVVGAQYGDAALSVYVKIAALAMRPEGCTAKVAVLAEYLGLSKSTTERAIRQLRRPDPVDGLIEVPTTQRTKPGGQGESAHRVVRQMDADELFVWIPSRAATSLAPRQLRVYAVIAHAQARNIPLALGDIADMVRHQSSGEPLGERQLVRLIDETQSAGWITVHRRQGYQGRHSYEAHPRPLHLIPNAPAAAPALAAAAEVGPDTTDGPGPGTCDGSLATREDHRTDRPVLKTEVGGGIRRRRETGSKRPAPVDNPPASCHPAGQGERRSSGRGYTGPGLQLSPRVWQVLQPVRHLLPGIRTYVLRRIAHEIGRQLAAGAGAERLTARLTHRYASTEPPRDAGRWILGAGLVRHGCGLDACESGVIWHTGHPCHVCLDNALHHHQTTAGEQQRVQPQERPPVPPAPPAQPAAVDVPQVRERPVGPARMSREQIAALRTAATPAVVRRAIAQHGRARAAYLYGWALVWPHLQAQAPDGLEGEDACAQ
ncbi:hypothetical protein [Streptomyces chryseus]